MDTLYIGDIPLDYKFAVFSNGYITLYNQGSARNETLFYYRIYTTNNGFYYSTGSQYFGNNISTFTQIPVSQSIVYRSDIDSIFLMTFLLVIFGLWLLNLITSCIRKGGVLGGLF